MKILHTADWHLGKKLEGISRLEEQRVVLEEICEIADREDVHVVLIAGDLFDTFNPSSESEELFYSTLKRLSKDGNRAVVAIAGNHDSPERIEAPDPLARSCGIFLAGLPHSNITPIQLESGLAITKSDAGFIELKLPEVEQPLRLILTPYANEYRLKRFLGISDTDSELRSVLENHWKNLAEKYCDSEGVNILMAHLFVTEEGKPLPKEPEEEKPILHVGGAQAIFTKNFPLGIDYVGLGHLHRRQVIIETPYPIAYAGSPLSYSFSEAGQQKSVFLLESNKDKPLSIEKIPLTKGRPLIRKSFDSVDKAVTWLEEHPEAIVELQMKTENFLSGKDKKRLYSANKDIFIIPDLDNISLGAAEKTDKIDLGQSMENLFTRYFEFRHGKNPDEAILELFKEVLAEEPGE